MNTSSIVKSLVAGALCFVSLGSAHAAALGGAVRGAVSTGKIKLGAGTVDTVRTAGKGVLVDMLTGKLAQPKGNDSYDVWHATASRGANGVKLTHVTNAGAAAMAALKASGKVAAGSTLVIGDVNPRGPKGEHLGELSARGNSIRIGSFTVDASGKVTNPVNHLVSISTSGKVTRIVAEPAKAGK